MGTETIENTLCKLFIVMNIKEMRDSMEKKVKILKRPDVSELAGEKVMIDFETGKYFMLKGSANEIWEMLKDGITVKEIVAGLMEIYEVEEEVCKKSVQDFLVTLKENGFINLE